MPIREGVLSSPVWTAVAIMDGAEPMLSPFFGRSDGLMVIDERTGVKTFLSNEQQTAEGFCRLVVEVRPRRLVCGFIGDSEKRVLQSAGIDVRLGLPSSSIDELVADFRNLPAA